MERQRRAVGHELEECGTAMDRAELLDELADHTSLSSDEVVVGCEDRRPVCLGDGRSSVQPSLLLRHRELELAEDDRVPSHVEIPVELVREWLVDRRGRGFCVGFWQSGEQELRIERLFFVYTSNFF